MYVHSARIRSLTEKISIATCNCTSLYSEREKPEPPPSYLERIFVITREIAWLFGVLARYLPRVVRYSEGSIITRFA